MGDPPMTPTVALALAAAMDTDPETDAYVRYLLRQSLTLTEAETHTLDPPRARDTDTDWITALGSSDAVAYYSNRIAEIWADAEARDRQWEAEYQQSMDVGRAT
jgi:hypothetical protein